MAFWEWTPYVSVGERKAAAKREVARLAKGGRTLEPVVVEGRRIARTFWGKAWCDNLEGYSDYESRLPRGRSYVCNGLVLHLAIERGAISALVSGTSVYEVAVQIAPVPNARWQAICRDSAGAIDSLVELLQGRFSNAVMERLCRQNGGLFPSPREITFTCSCPDYASMCKHVAAALYGTGARLDTRPELLFRLRGVDETELIAHAGDAGQLTARGPAKGKVLAATDLSALFGVEMAASAPKKAVPKKAARKAAAKKVTKTAAAKKPVAKKGGTTKRGATTRDVSGKTARRPNEP